MAIVCQNPALFDGTIAIAAFLLELGLDALSAYFENPEFAVIAGFIESIASAYAKDAAYAGIQMMLSEDPALSFIGGQLVQWAQTAPSPPFAPQPASPRTVVASYMTAIYRLANAQPASIYFERLSPEVFNLAGTPSQYYQLAGFTQIPQSTNGTPVSFFEIPIAVPLDPQSYQNRYGFPPPSNNDLGAFLVSGVAPQFKNYSAEQIGNGNWPQQAIDDLFSAFITWQNFCGSQSKPPPPPPHKQPPPPPPPPPPPDGGGDELTDCCNTTAYYLGLIAGALQNLTFPQGTDSGCCDQVVNAIGGVATQLGEILKSLPSLKPASGGSVDLTPIIDAIDGLKTALTELPAPQVTVSNTLDCPPDPNVKRIADSFAAADQLAAKMNALIQDAVDNLGFPARAAQIITST